MLTRTHRLSSIAIVEFGLIASHNVLINPMANVVLLLATGIGAVLPDIDEYNSSASRKSIINFSLFLQHRGLTHSLLGWAVFSVGLYYLMNFINPVKIKTFPNLSYWTSVWLGLVLGYGLHLIEDSFSKQGVTWFAPFSKRKIVWIFHYKVGGIFEKIVGFVSIISIIIMTFYWFKMYIKP